MKDVNFMSGERFLTERRTATFRKEQFDYLHTAIIDASGDSWTTTQLDEANLNQVYNQYRVKHGIPFPEEIIALRKYYGLSAAKMSEILGLGINQYRSYESGDMPSASNARILIAIRDKSIFLDFLDASKEIIGEAEYFKLQTRIKNLEEYVRPTSMPSALSGYVAFSQQKLKSAVEYFIKEQGGVFVTKMNKLLFYADFLSYRRKGYGMTGLCYVAMQFGPVPENWGKIYDSISGVGMNEYIFPDMSSGIELDSEAEPDMTVFDDIEISVLKEVSDRFKNVKAGEISKISHQESGWIENHKDRGRIDYSYAFDLTMQ